jgi:membrane-bound ClpP family serine protease
MVAVPSHSGRRAPIIGPGLCLLAGLLGTCLTQPAAAQAPEERGIEGMFITVPNPITESDVAQIEAKVRQAVERQNLNIGTVIFDFNPSGPSGTSKDGPCITLKNYIIRLQRGQVELANGRHHRANTIAFVHGQVSKFSVLPALACREMYMSGNASIGDMLSGYRDPVPPEVETACRDLAETTPWGDLVLRMKNGALPVVKVLIRDGPTRFWTRKKVDDRKNSKDRADPEPQQPSELESENAVFSARFAIKNGLAKPFSSREEIAKTLGLPRASLREDWLAGKTARAFRIEVNGTIDAGRLESLKRRVNAALRRNANLIILQLNCEGGDTTDVASYARFLKDLAGPGGPVKTVAYVPPGRSLGAATFLALGCSEIIMGDNSALGDFDSLRNAREDDLKPLRDTLEELASEQGYPPLLFRATLKKDVVLYVTQSGRWTQIVTEEQLEGRIPVQPGQLLKVSTALAKRCGVALDRVDAASVDEVYRHYDLDPASVTTSRDDWLDRVAAFFREPIVNVFLIMIGIAGLILEFKMPGLGFPAVIAGVCFVLFFWAHSFVGQFTMLAVLLFVLGLILIGLEVFVMPGIGVTGISGVVLLVGSLVLVTLDKMPESTADWYSLGTTLMTFVGGILAAVAVAFTLAWYLPHIPYANRLILSAPSAEDQPDSGGGAFGAQAAPAALLGAIGEAATALRPAGKARFGEDFLDVVSEGDFINPGSRVQIIEIESNRIVVKEV